MRNATKEELLFDEIYWELRNIYCLGKNRTILNVKKKTKELFERLKNKKLI